jgi:lipopolysaccharide export system permease protein
LYVALPITVLSAALTFEAIPWAQQAKEELKAFDEARSDISFVQPGKFNEFRNGDLIIYAEKVDPTSGRLQQVFVQDRQNGELGVIKSEEAWQFIDEELKGRFVVLASGHRYVGNPGSVEYQVASFDEYILRLNSGSGLVGPQKTSAHSMLELMASPQLSAKAEFAYRVSVPLGVIVFTVLAFVLSKSEPRKEVHGRLGFAILTYFIFFNLQRVGERWIVQDVLPHHIGLFWLLALMLAIAGIVMFFDSVKWRKLRQQLLSGIQS